MISAICNTKIYDSEMTNVVFDEQGIIYLGNDISKFKIDKMIDGTNLFVYPGFYDSHMHLVSYGFY